MKGLLPGLAAGLFLISITAGATRAAVAAEDVSAHPVDIEVVVSNPDAVAGHAPQCGCHECMESCNCCNTCCTAELVFHGPLPATNEHPTTALFLTPVPESASVLKQGESFLQFRLDHTNHIIRELDNGIILDMDFEVTRATFDYHVGTGDGEFSVNVPIVSRTHGFLDGIISDWHDWFGLPNGLRNTFPDNQYRFVIASRQGPVYNGVGDVFGLGDITLGYKHAIPTGNKDSAAAWRTAVKLPTGESDDALGSGNFDYLIGGLWERQFTPHWRGYVNVDYVFTGDPDYDNVGHQDVIVTLWSAEYAFNDDTSVVGQYRTHRNPLRIGSREADKDAQELTLGFHHRISDGVLWTGGFSEDINPETAPDFHVMSYFLFEL